MYVNCKGEGANQHNLLIYVYICICPHFPPFVSLYVYVTGTYLFYSAAVESAYFKYACEPREIERESILIELAYFASCSCLVFEQRSFNHNHDHYYY